MQFFGSIVALALATCASALTLNTPAGSPAAGQNLQVSWLTTQSGDPASFTLFLLDANNLPFGLAANFGEFQTASQSATVSLPSTLTTKSYQLRAVNSSNVDFVYASSADFVITGA